MPIKWIISDVDGCLAPEASVSWNIDDFSELARTIRAANAGQGTVAPLTLCTGRPQPYVEALMKLFDVRGPAICENGAVIYSLRDNVARFGPNVTPEKLEGLRRTRQFIEKTLIPESPGLVLQFGKEAQLSLYSAEKNPFGEARERLEDFVSRNGLPPLVITASHCYLNISMSDVNKENALRQLLEELESESGELAGIGDTDGDLPLRDAVSTFACPANSTETIRRVSDYVSPHEEMRGVLDILRQPAFRRA